MGFLSSFKLEKLKIQVYKSRERKEFFPTSFNVMFNPESYSQTFQNVFQCAQGIGTSGREARFAFSQPSDLKLKLIFDGTGVEEYPLSIFGSGKKDVYKRVDEFLNQTFVMDGSIHEPKYLNISWGKLSFDCRMKSVTINYTLFKNSGEPLRAELDTHFVNDIDDKKRAKKNNLSSPDLTHWRVVKAHDTLPAMCAEIYGSPHYCVKIARINKLNHFRELKPGQELFFPPVIN